MKWIQKFFSNPSNQKPIDWDKFVKDWNKIFGWENAKSILTNTKQTLANSLLGTNKADAKNTVSKAYTPDIHNKIVTEELLSNMLWWSDIKIIESNRRSNQSNRFWNSLSLSRTPHNTTSFEIENFSDTSINIAVSWSQWYLPLKIWDASVFITNKSNNNIYSVFELSYDRIAQLLLEQNPEYKQYVTELSEEKKLLATQQEENDKKQQAWYQQIYDTQLKEYETNLQIWEETHKDQIAELQPQIEELEKAREKYHDDGIYDWIHHSLGDYRRAILRIENQFKVPKPKKPTLQKVPTQQIFEKKVNYTELFEKYINKSVFPITVDIFHNKKDIQSVTSA